MDLFMKQAPQRHLTPRRLHLGVPGLPRTADGIPGLGRGTALGGGGGSQETLSPRGKGLPRAGAGGHPTQAASEAAGECKGGQAARRRRRGEVRRAGRIDLSASVPSSRKPSLTFQSRSNPGTGSQALGTSSWAHWSQGRFQVIWEPSVPPLGCELRARECHCFIHCHSP